MGRSPLSSRRKPVLVLTNLTGRELPLEAATKAVKHLNGSTLTSASPGSRARTPEVRPKLDR